MPTFKAGVKAAAAVVVASFGSAALAQSEPTRTEIAQSPPAHSEAVLGFRSTGDSLQIRVSTGGCTTANDFNVNVERTGPQANVTLVRVTPDNCKGYFPEGVEIAISYEAAGVRRSEDVQLTNQVVPSR